jgi:hypothetical protein
VPVTDVSHPISFILQRGAEDSGWGNRDGAIPRQTFCRQMDCWAACSAMVRRYPGGTTETDSASIDRVQQEYASWLGARMPGQAIEYPGAHGLSGHGVDMLCDFLGHGKELATQARPAAALLHILHWFARGPMLLFNTVLSSTGHPAGNHVTILHRIRVTTAGELSTMTDEEALAAEWSWADPWPAFVRPGVFRSLGRTRGFNGTTTREPPRLYYDGEPDPAGHSGTFPEYLDHFRILGWSVSPLRSNTYATPGATTTVARTPSGTRDQ